MTLATLTVLGAFALLWIAFRLATRAASKDQREEMRRHVDPRGLHSGMFPSEGGPE